MEQDTKNSRAEDWRELTEVRVSELEGQYETAHVTDLDKEALEQLRLRLTAALGVQNGALLRAYTEKLLAVYSRDVDWFYRKGWEDAVCLSDEIALAASGSRAKG